MTVTTDGTAKHGVRSVGHFDSRHLSDALNSATVQDALYTK
jgi:hypothetical protein